MARHFGWVVMRRRKGEARDRRAYKCQSEGEARQLAHALNAVAPKEVLWWAEFWSTSSTIGNDDVVPTEMEIASRYRDDDYPRSDQENE